jgi:hypothetical protein
VAVADVDRDGKQDIVIFMIDNPVGQNAGFYRVGKGLDANGNLAGGWGPCSLSRIGFRLKINTAPSRSRTWTAMEVWSCSF